MVARHDVVASAVGPRLPSDAPKLVVDAARSLAVAFVDEIENGRFVRQRMTVAY